MNIWEILKIEPNSDKKAIKKAYHAQLKNTNPEDNPEAFMRLREAYETALKYTEDSSLYRQQDYTESEADNQEEVPYNAQYNLKNDWKEYEEENHKKENYKEENYENREYRNAEYKDDAYLAHMYEKEQKLKEWWKRVTALFNDYEKRKDAVRWRRLLYEDIPYQIEFYQRCRTKLYNFLVKPNSMYLPREVRLEIDKFFSYSATHLERAKSKKSEQFRMINKKIKLCETIEFDKLIPNETYTYNTDNFCREYEKFLYALPYRQLSEKTSEAFVETEVFDREDSEKEKENETLWLKDTIQKLKENQVFYLPLECIYTALQFKEYSKNQVEEQIEKLDNRYKNTAEMKLLQVQYNIYQGQREIARRRLEELYREVPAKNYGVIYQMVECCKKVSMYYEAYMLVKMLTWLNPKPFMYDMAEEIYEIMENIYNSKKKSGKEISDLEHIHMCRMYLRSNREKDAIKVLKKVKDTQKHLWEYEMAHCLCIFYEEAKKEACNLYVNYEENKPRPVMTIKPAIPLFELLKSYPKNLLNEIEKLEWKELQGKYLFEQRRYEECISKCNELLEEYPLSYSILLLRSYADYGKNCLGPQHVTKEYGDFNFLISVLPRRIEARLVAANVMTFCRKFTCASEVLEPVKEVVPDHFAYYNFLKYKHKQPEKYKEGLIRLFKKAEESELSIPSVSKYRLLDLHNIFVEACEFVGVNIESEEEKKQLFSILEGMRKSKYNHPEKFVNLYWLYFRSIRREEALQIAKQQLESAGTQLEKQQAYCRLSDVYWAMGKLEESEKAMMFMQERDRIDTYAAKGRKYQEAGNNEKAVWYITKAKSIWGLNIRAYAALGKAYYEMGKKEKAIEAFWDGIKICKKSGDYYHDNNLYYDLYEIYKKEEEWDQAIKVLEEMRRHSNFENFKGKYYYYYLGYVYWRRSVYDGETDETDKVIELWSKAVEERLDYGDMYGRLAKIYSELGQTDKAVELIRKGIEVCGSSGDYLNNNNLYQDLYEIYRDAKMWNEAINAAELMNKYTNSDSIRDDYPRYVACVSIHNKDYKV